MRKGIKLKVSMMVTTMRYKCANLRMLSKLFAVSGSHLMESRLAAETGMGIYVFTIWKILTLKRSSALKLMRMRCYQSILQDMSTQIRNLKEVCLARIAKMGKEIFWCQVLEIDWYRFMTQTLIMSLFRS